eukprot:CAMPEP_0201721552 /NCGR_PEP_ID=MMETSP0593-20130828/6199_1 /ASSEMBLY_ACC=CAM_ASM_000672 /TAXON_ID=267983 /ORGANISM="Skeletonema japonicum, Strain CCMP2506" /LENGTH=1199 /DNA_ID=CAMNT_0048212383 /DNA_START=37 /DNA_END=3632 /DNA_ORIENTATION=+
MAKFSPSNGNNTSPTMFEKPAPEFEYDDDDDDNFTTPTAAPSRSLEEDDDEEIHDQYNMFDDTSAALPPQTSDVFRDGANKNAANNVPVAPTFPSQGALGRFDSDYGDESQGVEDEEDDEELTFLDNNDCFDDTTYADEEHGEKLKGDGEAVSSSLRHSTDSPKERRFSGSSSSSNNGGEFMPQSFRPFQSRNSEDNPINANLTGDMPTILAADTSNDINNSTTAPPQCRRTPSIITSSEASYIFQQLDELRTAPSGILYNQPKYLQPTDVISGNEFADSLSDDAIHAISSYCDGKSWMALCHTSKQWRAVGYDVWRKVRMHAFRCAGEVFLAWARGEHADARELAALYSKNGVRIYPSPLGHAYHTLSWKMGIEIQAKQSSDNESDGKSEKTEEETVDRFYNSRYKNQDDEADIFASSMLTYVEEKCVYWKKERGIESEDVTRTPQILPPFSPPMSGVAVDDGVLPAVSSTIHFHTRNTFSAPNATTTTPGRGRHSIATNTTKNPKMTVRVHRHLADQHFFGATSIDDENGDLNEVACNLNADFFHPQWERKKCHISPFQYSHLLGGGRHLHWQRQQYRWSVHGGNADSLRIDFGVSAIEAALEDVRRALANEALSIRTSRNGLHRGSSFLRSDSLPSLSNNSIQDSNGPTSNWNSSPASDVHLDIYSSSSSMIGGKSDSEEERKQTEIMSQVRSICARFQIKLESFLANFDTLGFDECLLDFWDNVFPLSQGIHFHNRHTAVPRMSSLQQFMTTPLPKAIGVMQCEIERVKTTSRAKGLGKGRIFPSYEYRLFIRDKKNDNIHNLPRFPPRKDSVLLVAKNNNGRRNAGAIDSGTATSKSTSSKRGVNYFLHLPQQRDVDMHYRSANEHLGNSKGTRKGLSASPAAAQSKVPIQVGRLQSNFIGTEFQIFSSKITMEEEGEELGKQSQRNVSPESDRQLEHGDQVYPVPDNGNIGTQHSSRRTRGSSLVRFARRASNRLAGRGSASDEDGGEEGQSLKKVMTRRVSWSSPRPSRRAIANNSDVLSSNMHPVTVEVENGAITYTANLFGNRPRIMDVCIPKLLEDGMASEEWRKVPNENAALGDGSDCQMLNRFKTIQQERGIVDGENTQDTDIQSWRNHGLMVFRNRSPWWNEELGAFVLNFGGRVSVASVKNFQLCERRDQDHIMQFGRIQGRHNFTMDFQHPLTPTQAFAIAISS